MRFSRILFHRFRSLLRRSRADLDLQRELELHIEQLVQEHVASGMAESEARLAARREFGSLGLTTEQCRDMRRVTFFDDLVKDLGYAFRLLSKSPRFTLTVILSLALGIGANTAIFSLVDAVLLRMLPVHEPQQLLEVGRSGGKTLSYPMYEAIRDRNQVFSGVLLASSGRFGASLELGDTQLGDVHLAPISGDYFKVLGISPVIGRPLTEDDLAAANSTVISYGLWQRAFAGDPAALGKTLRVGGGLFTVAGVAPAGFTGLSVGQPVDLWVPVTWMGRQPLNNPVAMMFRVVARKKPGVSDEQARANIELLARQWSAEWKFEAPTQVEVTSASGGLSQLRRRFSRPLLVLMTVVVLLLLIATANVANLLLARASARQREMGVRLSLGASRGRLIRQLLTESFVLGSAGGILGLLIAPVAAEFLVRFLSSAVGTIDLELDINTRVLAFTTLVSIAVVFLFGLAPALAATRLNLTPTLQTGASLLGSGNTPARTGRLLMLGQVSVSCVLLVAALLFARSLQTLTSLDAGFRPENVLLLHTDTAAGGPGGTERVRLYERVLERLAAVPGVRSAAFSSENLFSGNTWTEAVNTPDFMPKPGQGREVVLLVVSAGFFRTMDTQMVRGRDFNARDDEHAPRVAIVNEAMARYYFGRIDVVGRTFRVEQNDFPQPLTIVGLVRDAKYRSLKEAAPRIVYLPSLQTPGPLVGANLAVRTAANPEKMTDLLWKAAQSESPHLRFGGVTTQSRLVEGTIAQDRMLAQLSGFFGLTAAALVCLGLNGLTSYDVSRRTREIGLRIALGASRGAVVRLFLGRSMILVSIGLVLGMSAALVFARLLRGLLFGVQPADPAALLITATVLIAVGATAAYWPARRAAKLDPIASLRHE